MRFINNNSSGDGLWINVYLCTLECSCPLRSENVRMGRYQDAIVQDLPKMEVVWNTLKWVTRENCADLSKKKVVKSNLQRTGEGLSPTSRELGFVSRTPIRSQAHAEWVLSPHLYVGSRAEGGRGLQSASLLTAVAQAGPRWQGSAGCVQMLVCSYVYLATMVKEEEAVNWERLRKVEGRKGRTEWLRLCFNRIKISDVISGQGASFSNLCS